MRGPRRVAGILAVLLGIGGPQHAWGLWPLDRVSRVHTDSLSAPEWDTRFQTWRERPLGVPDSAQAAAESAMAELRKASESGVFDPSLLARLAKQAQSGQLDLPVPGAKPTAQEPGTPAATKAAAAGTDSIQGQSAPGTNVFGSADSLANAGSSSSAGSFADSAQAAADLSGTGSAPSTGPFQGLTPGVTTVFADRGFAPAFSASLNSNNDRMRLTSSLAAALADRSGLTLSASLGHDQELRLSQGSENETKNLLTSLTLPIRKVGLTFGVSASDARRTSLGGRSVTGRTSDSFENKMASTQAGFLRQIVPGVGLNLSYDRRFTVDEQSSASTQDASAGERSTQTTGNSYGAGIQYDPAAWMKLKGRYGRAVSSQLFTVSPPPEGNPSGETTQPSEGDTLSIRVDMPLGRLLPQLSADFQVRRTEFSYTDVSRTSSGSTGNAFLFVVETETRFSRALRIDGKAEPWKFLSTDFGIEVVRDSVSAAVRTNVFEDAKRARWSLGGTLRYPGNGQLRLRLDGTRADINKDDPKADQSTTQALNPQTRVDESRQLSGEILQPFTKTMKVRLYGNVELAQGFYAHAGPQGLGDRDDLRAQLGGDLDGQISSKASARVEVYVRGFNQAFIDPRRSKDSRNETEYVVRQRFDYRITPQVSLKQFYGLSSKVVDETFDPNGDTLNRNHFLQTTFNFKMTSRLTLDTRFDYRLQDNGFYVQLQPRSPERIFAPTARTKTDEIALGIRYTLIQEGKLSFISNQVSTREHRTIFFNGRATGVNVINRGNVALGLESKITMGDLQLDAKLARNQSFNVSLNRNVYYNVQSTLSYTF